MIETQWTLFNGRAGEDAAQVWLEAAGQGAVMRTQSWGPGVERHFGFDTIETWLRIDGPSLATLAHALVMDLDGRVARSRRFVHDPRPRRGNGVSARLRSACPSRPRA